MRHGTILRWNCLETKRNDYLIPTPLSGCPKIFDGRKVSENHRLLCPYTGLVVTTASHFELQILSPTPSILDKDNLSGSLLVLRPIIGMPTGSVGRREGIVETVNGA